MDRPRLRQAVALSGGPDSLCAAALMPPGVALIVNHNLRDGAGAEAEAAAKQAQNLGHEPRILHWNHGTNQPKPKTQAAYRAARYALLARACQDQGIDILWTGHQGDDQAETLLLRLSMASGLQGLSGMALSSWLGNTRLYRPLLRVTKAQILDWLRVRDLRGLHDPSNVNLAYPRVLWRQSLRQRPDLRDKLLDLSLRMGRQRNLALAALNPEWVQVAAPGCLRLDARVLLPLSRASLHELMAACVRWVGGRAFAPLDGLLNFLKAPGANGTSFAVGGVCVRWNRADQGFSLVPESRGLSMDQQFLKRADETQAGLWQPGNQEKLGGLIIGSVPKFDQVYATFSTSPPLND